MKKRDFARESAQRILWGDREQLMPHLFEHKCPVGEAVAELCATAGWTLESYMIAAFFDVEELIVQVTK